MADLRELIMESRLVEHFYAFLYIILCQRQGGEAGEAFSLGFTTGSKQVLQLRKQFCSIHSIKGKNTIFDWCSNFIETIGCEHPFTSVVSENFKDDKSVNLLFIRKTNSRLCVNEFITLANWGLSTIITNYVEKANRTVRIIQSTQDLPRCADINVLIIVFTEPFSYTTPFESGSFNCISFALILMVSNGVTSSKGNIGVLITQNEKDIPNIKSLVCNYLTQKKPYGESICALDIYNRLDVIVKKKIKTSTRSKCLLSFDEFAWSLCCMTCEKMIKLSSLILIVDRKSFFLENLKTLSRSTSHKVRRLHGFLMDKIVANNVVVQQIWQSFFGLNDQLISVVQQYLYNDGYKITNNNGNKNTNISIKQKRSIHSFTDKINCMNIIDKFCALNNCFDIKCKRHVDALMVEIRSSFRLLCGNSFNFGLCR